MGVELSDFSPTIEVASSDSLAEAIEMLKCNDMYLPGMEGWIQRSTTLVARWEGKVIGMRCFERTSGRYYHVHTLFVRPEYRRRGLGEMLCREAERMMWRQGGAGYVGEAKDEEMAQWYVRTLGVRIRRLSFRGWREGCVPYAKAFRQEGLVDRFLLLVRRMIISCMRVRLVGRVVEGTVRRIEALRQAR